MTLSGDKTITSLPYSYNINDKQAFESANMTPADFQDAICRHTKSEAVKSDRKQWQQGLATFPTPDPR
jgi:hypothetical protein